jgi:hypothetical protein
MEANAGDAPIDARTDQREESHGQPYSGGVEPRMPKAAWAAEVAKMRNVYKAPVDEKDVPAIVDYLTAVKGPK